MSTYVFYIPISSCILAIYKLVKVKFLTGRETQFWKCIHSKFSSSVKVKTKTVSRHFTTTSHQHCSQLQLCIVHDYVVHHLFLRFNIHITTPGCLTWHVVGESSMMTANSRHETDMTDCLGGGGGGGGRHHRPSAVVVVGGRGRVQSFRVDKDNRSASVHFPVNIDCYDQIWVLMAFTFQGSM